MFLKKKTYIGAQYEHRNVKGKVEITIDGKPVNINFNRIGTISEDVGYWRKANAIHKWFVDNCQDGEDDCRETYVSEEQLTALLNVCKQVKANHKLSESLLPPSAGFFFGGTEIDEGYFEDLDDTIKIIEDLLSEKGDKDYLDFEVFYRSSW